MKKGRFGIVYSFYAILAFVGVILKLPILCALVLGFVLLAEKDEWTGRQTLQGLLLSLVVVFFGNVVTWAVSLVSLPFFTGFLATVASVVSALVYAAAIVLSILAILRVMKDEEANLPLFSEIAYHAYGKTKPKPAPAPGQYPPPYAPPQPGQVPPQYAQPPVPPQYGAPQNGGPQVSQQNGVPYGAPPQPGDPQNGGPQAGGPQF